MERFFTILTAVTVALILVVGVGVYMTSKIIVGTAKEEAAQAEVKTVAHDLAGQISLLNKALDKVAQDPNVIDALVSLDPARQNAVASQIEKYIPEVKKIRLLPIGVIEPDVENTPKMGFGDIDMVKATFQGNPMPAIQGEGQDRHLAITRRVMQGQQPVGIVLASMSYGFIEEALKEAEPSHDRVIIKQAKLTLAQFGEAGGEDEDLASLAIPGTDWLVYYPDPKSNGLGQGIFYFSLIFIPIVLVLGIFYICYQQLSVTLAQDQDWILTAFKDILISRPKGSYPVTLKGMDRVVASMGRYKHEVEQKGIDILKTTDNDFELEGFFDGMGDAAASAKNKASDGKNPPKLGAKNYDVQEIVESPQSVSADATAEVLPAEELAQPIISPRTEAFSAIFRAYDIRGTVGKTLTSEIVYEIGKAFASEARENGCKTIVVGRDGRLSSPELASALSRGIIATGCHVFDVGLVPTPVLYFVTHHTEGKTGIMITGSHNPPEYNGLKLMMKGDTLSGDRIQKIKQRIDSQAYLDGEGVIEQNSMFESEYIGTLSDDIQLARNLKVVVDCGNGAASELAPVLLSNLGCEVIKLYCEVDGNFPNHHPDPSKPENLAVLIKAVKDNEADIGLAFDGDGDRLGVVDSNGKIIWPDRQMMLFAKDVLAGKPGSEIIFDVKCSRHLPTQIVKYGGRPMMWKTGHSFIKAKLKETGAKLAGEMSGHIFFNDRWFGFDDAIYAAARLLQILSEDDRPSAEVFEDFPDSCSTPELNVEMDEGENQGFIKKLFASAKFTGGKITDIDGMRIDFSDGWGLVRASNTTPSLVIRFEADNKDALENIQAQFRDLMRNVKPDIKLPF